MDRERSAPTQGAVSPHTQRCSTHLVTFCFSLTLTAGAFTGANAGVVLLEDDEDEEVEEADDG